MVSLEKTRKTKHTVFRSNVTLPLFHSSAGQLPAPNLTGKDYGQVMSPRPGTPGRGLG